MVSSMLVLGEAPSWVIGLAVVGFVIISLLMMLVVLIQKPQGGGLSGAFGAGGPEGAGQTAFGAKTGDVLTTATIGIFVVFLATAVGLNFLVGPPVAPTEEAVIQEAGEESAGLPAPVGAFDMGQLGAPAGGGAGTEEAGGAGDGGEGG